MIVSRRLAELAMALVAAALGLVVCFGSLRNGIGWGDFGPESGAFPFAVGSLIVFGAVCIAAQALRARVAEQPAFANGEQLRAVASFFVPLIGFAAASAFLGLYIGMALYAFYAMRFPGGLSTARSVVVALLVVAANWMIFEILFTVPLDKGPVLEALGIY